ncbi:hypothetical protein BSK71_03380 [Pectobacterium actinidiae]|uniref:Uncharacterized protein n=1 Tax=Pectobacterium actinidiae TaxID=1507808 RepID=A0A1V2R7F5_9GAMM|nr:hypothetical protein BSK69_09300 [Pectobacterium actinidiae]ONK08295.1 hypothetical protein BSK71_03380 [Pectobacterium actinidiae]
MKDRGLDIEFDVALRHTAAGENFILLDAGQRGLTICYSAFYQTQSTGAAIAGAALIFNADSVRFQHIQQGSAVV